MNKPSEMKNHLLILFTICLYSCNAQNGSDFEYDNFEKQFLNYEPTKRSLVSEEDFDYACMIIRETKSRTKSTPENFDLADYFNVLSAFLTLNESEKNIKTAFEKFKDADGSCEYILSFENTINEHPKYDIIRADYLVQLEKCKQEYIAHPVFDLVKYCHANDLDLALVEKIQQVKIDDQKYRNELSESSIIQQQELDKRNQEIIDSLYHHYKTYLGKSLVGEEFESEMWAVIQHSDTEMMAEYLPIIQKAVKENELDVVPFKMLIDRYYGLKYGYQVFGSQSGFGFELADDKKRKEIELKYGIE